MTEPYQSPTATGDCRGLQATLNVDFVVEPIVSDTLFKEVTPYRVGKMAFDMKPGAQYTDIYIAEKGAFNTSARALFYDGAARTLKVIGTLPNANDDGAGVTRVWLDPITRKIDFNSEKVLLHIPAGTTGRWFTGGGLAFDNAGNLYLSIGDNESGFNGPANTADLRGSLLRIRPDTSSPKGHSIPPGNFGEYWAKRFEALGRRVLAAKYRDTAKVKPELYVKGLSHVFSFTIDPLRPGRIVRGQCGPDAQRGETYSMTEHPVFGGWPFWVSNNGSTKFGVH